MMRKYVVFFLFIKHTHIIIVNFNKYKFDSVLTKGCWKYLLYLWESELYINAIIISLLHVVDLNKHVHM